MPNFIYMSAIAVPLIAVIVAVRFFTIYKVPKKTFYVLWSIVLCCLFIPFNLFPHLNTSDFIDKFNELKEMFAKIPEATEVLANPINISAIEDTVNISTEATSPSATSVIYNIYDTIDRFGRDMLGRIDMISTAGLNPNNPNIAEDIVETPVKTSILNIPPILLIWLAGFLICAVYFTVSHIKFRRKYASSLPVDNTFVRSWRVERFYSTRRKIKIKQSDLLASPLTYGIIRPVILLPKTTDYSDEKKLEYILTHEYTHIRRFDALAKLFLTAALCVHWFNPFVWLMFVLANRDIELSCDETVVKKVKTVENTKSDYALTLIALEEKKSKMAFGVYFSKNIMKERIKSIMKIKKMSKARILLAVILVAVVTTLFFTLQSCTDNADSDTVARENNVDTTDTPVILQEQTDKLVVYVYFFNEQILTPALNLFKEMYPDVDLEIREFEGVDGINEYYQLIKTEIAAGKGTDLLVVAGSEIDNIYKTMDADIFADLNPFIKNDNDFYWDDYNKAMLDSGVYNGKRYVMPLEYEIPVIITTQEILDAEGIKLSDLATFDGFINTINNYTEKYKDNPDKSAFKSETSWDIINYSFPWCGINLIDYQAKKTGIDNPYFKTVMDAMKYAYRTEENYLPFGVNIIVDALKRQEWLFDFRTNYNIERFMSTYANLCVDKLTPVFLTYPNIDNKTTALTSTFAVIPKSSPNQVNAYNLMKILLSEEVQGGNILTYYPVSKNAAINIFENLKQDLGVNDDHKKYYGTNIKMSEEESNRFIESILNIDSCVIMDKSYSEFLYKDMVPYYEGKQTFEQFLSILKNKLELYISE